MRPTADHRARTRTFPGRLSRALVVSAIPFLAACGQEVRSQASEYTTASVPQFAPTEAPGHPLMAPQAIMSAAANFPQCVASLWPQAAKRGVSRATFEAATHGLEPDLQIMELLDRQPEFTKPVWEYLDLLVNEKRIATGREMLAKHAKVFDAVEQHFGVDRHIVTAIWGIESNYGPQGGERSVIRSTATLACIGRRQDYFRDEFLAALEILHRGDVAPQDLKGSWAGAFGPTQFMPTSFKRYALDFDGDGRRDVVNSIPDVLASTANNLRKDGWHAGATWGYEVVLPERFDFLLADRSIRKSLHQWEALGVRRAGGKPFPRPGDTGTLMLPAGANGPAFVVIDNFRAIMKYNPSESYALAIGHLADRIRGGEPFMQPWPRDQLPLSRTERFEMQERLAALGLYRGPADGKFGATTRAAIRDFQARAGLIPDGFASSKVLERLRQGR
ncbi:MAG: lytic murein transglycosylase [Bradyrhizobiaceae bacterium]|nr:lytic murein transglycosylase [Bradyrhizobiaceae bacterium]